MTVIKDFWSLWHQTWGFNPQQMVVCTINLRIEGGYHDAPSITIPDCHCVTMGQRYGIPEQTHQRFWLKNHSNPSRYGVALSIFIHPKWRCPESEETPVGIGLGCSASDGSKPSNENGSVKRETSYQYSNMFKNNTISMGYCGWLRNPAPAGRWSILLSHDLQCFIVTSSYQPVQDFATIHSIILGNSSFFVDLRLGYSRVQHWGAPTGFLLQLDPGRIAIKVAIAQFDLLPANKGGEQREDTRGERACFAKLWLPQKTRNLGHQPNLRLCKQVPSNIVNPAAISNSCGYTSSVL